MDSESEHEHRDDESVGSGPEEEEVKPKSALKKTREVLPPVERPHLPYGAPGFIRLEAR
jgi:translation initiation factor 2 subunit 3